MIRYCLPIRRNKIFRMAYRRDYLRGVDNHLAQKLAQNCNDNKCASARLHLSLARLEKPFHILVVPFVLQDNNGICNIGQSHSLTSCQKLCCKIVPSNQPKPYEYLVR